MSVSVSASGEKTARLYGLKDQDRLFATEPQEVALEVLDTPSNNSSQMEDAFPIKVYEYERIPISLDPQRVLDDVIEILDEDYADPDGDDTVPTERMVEASKRFVEVIKEEYVPTLYSPTGKFVEYSFSDALEISKQHFNSIENTAPETSEDNGVCKWNISKNEEGEDMCLTDCGELFVYEGLTPNENRMRYCCYCGNKLSF